MAHHLYVYLQKFAGVKQQCSKGWQIKRRKPLEPGTFAASPTFPTVYLALHLTEKRSLVHTGNDVSSNARDSNSVSGAIFGGRSAPMVSGNPALRGHDVL